ncbi:ferric iron uptake transcriptional regulator [Inmirania thermothiophila]|uniref:Ferric uptake regulation protein n=1 Tax=Inmirania thermothiophila TaxID=1750597 RepID=A0A3N1XZN9_9GAMM|nr:ferric iron uptake transcriptional regulator [Inmirania thermothiophila]ROR32074.1 Fur family ferric uptake transcriptional regulator [Inmirania thermothiophila]
MQSDDIRNAGLKVTVPRVKILQMLEESPDRHLGAEDIYKQLLARGEEIGLATVYRVLTQFEAAGLIKRHHFEGGHAVYELNQGGHHDHIVCVRCGRVDEFTSAEIERLQRQVAAEAGYEIRDHVLYIYGLCARCRADEQGRDGG